MPKTPIKQRGSRGTNLSLNKAIVLAAKNCAKARYDISLTELVERLLRKEVALKRGLAHRLPPIPAEVAK